MSMILLLALSLFCFFSFGFVVGLKFGTRVIKEDSAARKVQADRQFMRLAAKRL